MALQHESLIIKKLVQIIDGFSDGKYRDAELAIEIHSPTDCSIYRLITKGERDAGTPFYCGSVDTHIVKEDYLDGELVYATIII